MKSFPQPLSVTDEAHYLKQYEGGDMEARDILIQKNLRLVAHIVKKYTRPGRDTEELIAVGIIGLVKAVNTYNFQRGSRLATYAARCIENELLMLMRSERKLSREVSIYDPVGTDKEGNEINLMDIIESRDMDVVAKMTLKENLSFLSEIFHNVLAPREQLIIKYRYGIYGYPEITQREIAGRLNISRSYVSRIEKKALSKLRAEFQNHTEI